MSTEEFTIALFCRVDAVLHDVVKHPQAVLYPSEVVTLALLFALKGTGERAFYRWLVRDLTPLFPHLPERTRLFRLFRTHQEWIGYFMAAPTVLGVADTYGIELIHPWREGRSPRQIGKKGMSNRRWIVGGKLALVLNQWGLVAAWDCATAAAQSTRSNAEAYVASARIRSSGIPVSSHARCRSGINVPASVAWAKTSYPSTSGDSRSWTTCTLYSGRKTFSLSRPRAASLSLVLMTIFSGSSRLSRPRRALRACRRSNCRRATAKRWR